MKLSVFLIGFLAISCVVAGVSAQKKMHDTKAHLTRKQIVAEETKQNRLKVDKIKADLAISRKEGNKNLESDLRWKLKIQKRALRRQKTQVKLRIDRAHVQGQITYYKKQIKLEKKAGKPDQTKIKVYRHKLRAARREQERYRVIRHKRLARKIKHQKRVVKRLQKKVDKCQKTPETRKCRKVFKKFVKVEAKLVRVQTKRNRVEKKISQARRNHVQTFRKVKSIEVKQSIIANRFHVKIENIEHKIEKLQKKLRRMSEEEDKTSSTTRRAERLQKKIASYKLKESKIRKTETKAISLKSTGPGDCGNCENTIHKILNEIHIHLVFHTKSGETITKEIVTSGAKIQKPAKKLRTVTKKRLVKREVNGFEEKEVTGRRKVLRARNRQVVKRWSTDAVEKRASDEWRDHKVKREHRWTTTEQVKVPRRVVRNHRVKVLKKWVTIENRKVPVVVKADGQTKLVKKTFTRQRRVPVTKFRQIVKSVPYEEKKWATKKVLVMKQRKFRRQALEYKTAADGKGYYHWVTLSGFDVRQVPTLVDQQVLQTVKKTKQVTVKQPYQAFEIQPEKYTVEVRVPVPGTHVKTIMVSKPVKVFHQKYVYENKAKEETEYKTENRVRHHREVREGVEKRKHRVYRDVKVRRHHSRVENRVEMTPETETYKYKVRVPRKTHKMVEETYNEQEEI